MESATPELPSLRLSFDQCHRPVDAGASLPELLAQRWSREEVGHKERRGSTWPSYPGYFGGQEGKLDISVLLCSPHYNDTPKPICFRDTPHKYHITKIHHRRHPSSCYWPVSMPVVRTSRPPSVLVNTGSIPLRFPYLFRRSRVVRVFVISYTDKSWETQRDAAFASLESS